MTTTVTGAVRAGSPSRPPHSRSPRSRSSRSRSPQSPPPRWDRRWWFIAGAALLLWSVWSAGVRPSELINERGWRQVADFFSAMVRPDLSADMVSLTLRESAVTVGYAVLGSALAVAIGLVGGVLLTERMWRPQHGVMGRGRFGWVTSRLAFAVPRSMHEVVFGLLLVNILGLDPLVAVLAIGIPNGAVIAKVFAELLDDVPPTTEATLRASGAGRLGAFVVGTVPHALSDLLSYAFYRLECALRAAAVLGIVGAGGLGFQLALSFQSLRYEEMWTLLWALIILSGLADRWSSVVRRRRNALAAETHVDTVDPDAAGISADREDDSPLGDRVLRGSAAAFLVAVPLSWWWLDMDITSLWSRRARTLTGELVADSLPPSIGVGGWSLLIDDALNTVAMSVLAIVISFAIGWPLAFLASRPSHDGAGVAAFVRRVGAAVLRFVMLISRSVPPPVWAFVVVFVLFPGLWPAAVGLAIYNFGVLGRLMGEVVENQDPRPARQLGATGASPVGMLAFATVPAVAGRFAGLGLYRWEVLIRETVVVGVVGASSLGRRLDRQASNFDYDGIVATIIALFVVTMVVDLASAAVRRSLR